MLNKQFICIPCVQCDDYVIVKMRDNLLFDGSIADSIAIAAAAARIPHHTDFHCATNTFHRADTDPKVMRAVCGTEAKSIRLEIYKS